MDRWTIFWTLLCLAAGAAMVYFAAGRMRADARRTRPRFRTRLDLDEMDDLMQARRYEEAEKRCREVLERDEGDHEAHCYLASCLMGEGREDAARAELMGLAACARPRDPWVFSQLGYLFAEDGQVALARWALDRGLELFPHDIDLLVSRSRMALDDGETMRALGYAQEAILEDPRDVGALWAKTVALEALESYDEAEACLETLKEVSPDTTDVALEYAHIALQQGRPDEALEICDRELMKSPKNGLIYLARATVMARSGNCEKALAQIERARELGEPEDSLAWTSLEPLCGLGRKDEAYAILDGLIRRESPLLDTLQTEAFRKDYPLLTAQEDFRDFLEKRQ